MALLTKRLADQEKALAGEADAVVKRDARNAGREVVLPYEDDADDRVRALVARAKKLTETPK